MIVQGNAIIREEGHGWSRVCVVVPLYNYADYITETLNSLLEQTLAPLSLIVVDDGSKDESCAVVDGWMRQFGVRFERCILARNVANAGLAITRNTAIGLSGSENIFLLDADNLLYPQCLERHLEALDQSPEAMAAYSLIERFDAEAGVMGTEVFTRERLKYGNHIDAMAMVRRAYLEIIGGYNDIKYGWEDYDLWLRMCENGDFAIQIPQILSRYRVHAKSMLRTVTNVDDSQLILRKNMKRLYNWLELK